MQQLRLPLRHEQPSPSPRPRWEGDRTGQLLTLQIGELVLRSEPGGGEGMLRQEAFDELHERQADPEPWTNKIVRKLRAACCRQRSALDVIAKALPCVELVRTYKPRQYLLADLLAGLSVSILHLSQGLGYSVLCGLPPVYGIYVSFFHPLVYFFFGTSRQLSIGTFSLVSLMVGAVINREVELMTFAPTAASPSAKPPPGLGASVPDVFGNSTSGSGNASGPAANFSLDLDVASNDLIAAKVQLAVCLSLLVGAFQLALGVLRFGFITSYLSPPFVGGFTCASALHIATSQLRFAAFGKQSYIRSSTGPFKFFKIWYEFFSNVTHANWLCAVCFLASCAVLLAVKQGINKNPRLRHKLLVPVPVDFVVVVVATLLSCHLDFERVPTPAAGVLVIGPMPQGLPVPSLPSLSVAGRVAADAFLIAVVSYLFNYSMVSFFDEKYKYKSDENQELIASGLLHVIGSFFSCFPGAASPPRCFMQDSSGCKTQLCSLVSCAVMLVVLYAVGPYLYWLPFSVVAALIVVSLKRLMLQMRDLGPLFAQDKIDFAIWVATFVLTLCLDSDYGMMAGIVVSLVSTAVRMQLKKVYVAGELYSLFESNKHYTVNCVTDDVVVLKYEAPLLYPNADRFRKMVLHTVDKHFQLDGQCLTVAAAQAANGGGCTAAAAAAAATGMALVPRAVVIDCSFVSCLDVAGLRSLRKLHKALQRADLSLLLAACSLSVRGSLRAAAPELYQLAFVSVQAALAAASRDATTVSEASRV